MSRRDRLTGQRAAQGRTAERNGAHPYRETASVRDEENVLEIDGTDDDNT